MWQLYGIILVAGSSVYLLPQIMKMQRTKAVRDLSGIFLGYLVIVHFSWLIFNIHMIVTTGWGVLPYFINNLFRCLLALVTLVLYFRYKE